MEVNHILVSVGKTENSESPKLVPSSLSSSPWVNRLKYRRSSEYSAQGTMALEFADASNNVRVDKELDNVTVLTEIKCSYEESEKKIDSWMRRWCHNSQHRDHHQERIEKKHLQELVSRASVGEICKHFQAL